MAYNRSLLQDELVLTSILDSINDGGEKWLMKISNEFTREACLTYESPIGATSVMQEASCLTTEIIIITDIHIMYSQANRSTK